LDSHSLEVLDFPKVREVLAGLCQTEVGRERALALFPVTSRDRVGVELDRLSELAGLPDEPALSDIKDLRPLAAHLRAQGLLTAEELLRVRVACTAVRKCREFFDKRQDKLHTVRPLVQGLVPQPHLEKAIDRAIDEAGEVRDSATSELADIRRRLRRLRDALVEKLEGMAAERPEWFGGAVAVRGGRFVLPLLAEHRGRIQGVIHGTSGTGHTLFVEPLQMVGEGNELAELRDAETEEVARVLRDLSHQVAVHEPELSSTVEAAGAIDLLNAKRRFAARFDCVRPGISDDGTAEIRKGRHPVLLHRRVKVVPLDFRFPDDAHVVIISGPNAGGKTVVLKTLGLFSLMLGAGMFLPAGDGTRLPVFSRVFADIGDEQSLETDLSSFTAHVGRLKEVLDQADSGSLVLVDEIGASTSPEEGAVIAVAVLEELRDRKVKAVATTHFGALKMFAQDEPGMANAAMEYRGGPTYRLKMGFPGESSALDIAACAGLPRRVLGRARERIGREWLDLGAKLRALDEELRRAQAARASAELEQQTAARLRLDYDARLAQVREEERQSRERLRDQEEKLLRDKRREIENLVRRIKEDRASHESVKAAKTFVEQELAVVETSVEQAPVVGEQAPQPREPGPGDVVQSHTFRRQGVVVSVEGDAAVVAFGQIRMELSRADLEVVQAAEVRPEPEPVQPEAYRFNPHLNVMGMTRDEAEEATQKFLDEAVAVGSSDLSILHGKGTGVLRRTLWDRLRRDSRVEGVRLAEAAQGGAGVTVVKLKAKA
jgi:DNA mismatch repair protein MutS2